MYLKGTTIILGGQILSLCHSVYFSYQLSSRFSSIQVWNYFLSLGLRRWLPCPYSLCLPSHKCLLTILSISSFRFLSGIPTGDCMNCPIAFSGWLTSLESRFLDCRVCLTVHSDPALFLAHYQCSKVHLGTGHIEDITEW